jgi:hypothetical protein
MFLKLRNSFNALLLSSAVCTLGALTAAALPLGGGSTMPEAQVVALPATRLIAQAVPTQEASGSQKAGKSRRLRPSAGMPYFSFVPRG